MKRITLILKGMAMGTADVIPGVSGGTLALILGIYKELVDTIKGLSPTILFLCLTWLKNGRTSEDFEKIREEFDRLNIMFLVPLGTGIVSAIVVGSVIIPSLMESYPVAMRALFFGLIAASVFVPFRMIKIGSAPQVATVALMAALGGAAGFVISNPANSFSSSRTWTTVTPAESMPLKDVLRRGPSSLSAEQVFWDEKNTALRDAVETNDAETFAKLAVLKEQHKEPAFDKKTLKARSEPYQTVSVPKGTPVDMPQPTLWFVFLAGLIAICAMILPGISGSYILLIFGVYFFVLNSLKGFLSLAASGEFSTVHLAYVSVFCAGCLIGILSFARLLSYLLDKHAPLTLGVLVGLMVGCLRGIWPFRDETSGVAKNIMPAQFDETVISAIVACLLGAAVVAGFTWLGRSRSEGEAVNA